MKKILIKKNIFQFLKPILILNKRQYRMFYEKCYLNNLYLF